MKTRSIKKQNIMKTTTIFKISVILVATTALAQNPKWEDGYIVSINRDTIYGEVQFVEYVNGSSHINFWNYSGAPGNESKYTACDISSFKKGNEEYDAKEVGAQYLFLKRVVAGYATLYQFDYDSRITGWPSPSKDTQLGDGTATGPSYAVSNRKHMYLLELTNGNIEIVVRKGFKRAMKKHLADCPETLKSIKNGNQHYKHLEALITFYNGCSGDHSRPIASNN